MEKILLEAIPEPGERLTAATKHFMEGRFSWTAVGNAERHYHRNAVYRRKLPRTSNGER